MRIDDKEEYLNLLRKISATSKASQRDLSSSLGVSLGKINYCLKSLQKKGLVKIKNFKKQSNKINYLQYVITPKGIAFRTKLTINFMKRKIIEYDELKKELKQKNK
jgi:EPS-associated MarR family transcriptional regulator